MSVMLGEPGPLDHGDVLKARRLSWGWDGTRYFVSVNNWQSKVVVGLKEVLDTDSKLTLHDPDLADSALWLAIEKGMAKWLKETK